jgi:hypothetical protein
MKQVLLRCFTWAAILASGAMAQTRPTAVQEVDVPAKRAFQIGYSMPNLKGGTNVVATVTPTRRWVIESVSMECYTAPGHIIYRLTLNTTVAGSSVNHAIPLEPQGTAGNLQRYAALIPVKLYADGGTQLQLTGWSTHPEGGQCLASFSGYWMEIVPFPY